METIDSFIVVLIFFISFGLRIWKVAIPDCVVFDEYHFGQFTNDYIDHNFFFDIHPPLGKLIYYLFAKFINYNGSLSFKNVNSSYINENFVFFRIIPVILSSFIPCFIYIILRNSSISLSTSFLTIIQIIFEISIISQSRFILIEGIQHFFICLHLLILTFSHNMILIGISLGFSISVKMTSFSLIPFTLTYLFIVNIQHNLSIACGEFKLILIRNFLNFFVIFSISFFTFISITIIHLSLLKKVTNDAIEYLPNKLFNDLFINKMCKIKSFFELFKNSIEINFLMNEINQKNKQIHPYSSSPIEWPLLTGIWVGMWSNESNEKQINCMGNAFVFYFCFFGIIKRIFQIVLSIIFFGLNLCKNKNKLQILINCYRNINVASFAIFGWIFSYFPFFFVKRTLFLYHYQISLIFSMINFAFVFHDSSIIFHFIAAFLSFFGFVYWSPFLYGTLISEKDLIRKVWNHKWRFGDVRHRKLIEAFFEDFQF